MAKVGVQRKLLLPEGSFQVLEILSENVEPGYYGPQWSLELKVVSGEYAGHVFRDWPALKGSVIKDDRGEPVGLGDDVAFKQDSKAWQVYLAVVGEEPNDSADTSVVVGGRLMARMELSENGKRNRLGYNSIGAAPGQGAGESDAMGADDRAGEGSLRDAQHRAAEASGGWYVEGESVPDPEPPEETR